MDYAFGAYVTAAAFTRDGPAFALGDGSVRFEGTAVAAHDGATVTPLAMDVRSLASIEGAFQRIATDHEKVDCLVNCAGVVARDTIDVIMIMPIKNVAIRKPSGRSITLTTSV